MVIAISEGKYNQSAWQVFESPGKLYFDSSHLYLTEHARVVYCTHKGVLDRHGLQSMADVVPLLHACQNWATCIQVSSHGCLVMKLMANHPISWQNL